MKYIFFIIVFLFIGTSVFCQNDALNIDFQDLENRFQQGLSIYKSGPEHAKKLFGEIGNEYMSYINIEKMSSPGIFYNAGNAFFMAEDYGMAILSYKKGLLMDPGNRDLKFNLNAARLARRNDFSNLSTLTPLKVVLFWHYYFSDMIKLIISVFLLLAVLFIKKRKRIILYTGIASFILFIIFSISLFITATANANQLEGVITAQETVLRKGDNSSYTPVIEEPLYSGAEFILLKKRNGWLHISVPGLADGWIQKEYASFVE